MPTKEDILRKVMIDAYEEYWNEKAPIGSFSFFTDIRQFHVYDSMEIYAKQQSMEFAKWYRRCGWSDCKEWHDMVEKNIDVTDDQLYQLFLKSQNTIS